MRFSVLAKTVPVLCLTICLNLCGCTKSDPAPVEVSEEYKYVISTVFEEPEAEQEGLESESLDSAPSQSAAETEYVKETASSFFWMNREEEVEIVRYAGDSTLVDVPSELLGTAVTIIGSYCFSDSNVVGIKLPDSVHTLSDNAFSGAETLETVYIPASVTSLGENLFDEDTSITIVVQENSPAKIHFDSLEIPVTVDP